MDSKGKVRVIIAKSGLDGHDRGAKVVARAYVEAGFEVIYTGRRQTPGQIVNAAIQEDADLIGISCLSGDHLLVFKRVMGLLKERGAEDIVVIGGGIIPAEDIEELAGAGVKKIFLPGTSLTEIEDWTRKNVKLRGEKN